MLKHYEKPEEAQAAQAALDGTDFEGSALKVEVSVHCPFSSCSLIELSIEVVYIKN